MTASAPPLEADIIFAGGKHTSICIRLRLSSDADYFFYSSGTTGCVIAGRLASADPSLRILIIEAGPPTLQDLAHLQPARYLSHLLPGSPTIKRHIGKESANIAGRSPVVPSAQCLGGGSSVNCTSHRCMCLGHRVTAEAQLRCTRVHHGPTMMTGRKSMGIKVGARVTSFLS